MRYLYLILILTGVLMANSLPKYYTKTLDNGLQIVAIPMKNGSDVITTDVIYKVGSRNEIMGKSGIAHMLEHMNFKSTKNLKAGEFDRIVKGFGGVNNASTGFDFTHYFIKSSSENIGKSLKLFAELMENLKLTDKEFQPERKVVMEERRWRTDNSPTGYLYFRLFNNAFTYHPYHWTPIGFKDDIKNWSIKDIRDFHKKYYRPDNAIVIVAGDIKKDVVFNETEKYFEHIKNSKVSIEKNHQIEPVQDGAKRVEIKKESEVEMVAIAYKIPAFDNPDQVALSALSELLSSGKSSKLQTLLVDKKKMVNQVYAYNMEEKDPSIFLFLAVCNPGVKAQDVEKEILGLIQKIKDGGISEKEVEKVKTNTKSDFIFSMESSSSLANLFGSYFARGDIKPLENYEERINKLNKDDIIKVAKKYLVSGHSTTVILKKDFK
jgi:predicted Zn-dependent peptidase